MITEDGTLIISGETVVRPGLLETDFIGSPLGAQSRFDGANDGYSRYRSSGLLDGGQACHLSLFFLNGTLKTVTFKPIWPGTTTSWSDWNQTEELKIKHLNDKLLENHLGPPPYDYEWGSIGSEYDPRGGTSNIIISYA